MKGGSITTPIASWGSLDPGAATSHLSTAPMYGLVYGHLFFQGLSGKITPDLALSYSASANGLTGYLKLRHGVTFSDGTPFNAKAVVWNFGRYENATAKPGPCPCLQQLAPVKSQNTNGDYEVVFHFSHPYGLLAMLLAQAQFTYMLDPTAYMKLGATQFGITPVGAGPFKITADQVDQSATFVKNPSYYKKGEPYLDTINAKAIAQAAELYTGVSSGTLAFAGFTDTDNPTWVKQSKKQSALEIEDQPLLANSFVQLNVKSAPFNNPLARKALYEATDPAPIVKNLVGNGAEVADILNPPGTTDYPGNKPTPGYPSYDLAAAKKLVQQLGGISFTMIPVASTSGVEAIETALQQQWEAAGMKVAINNVNHDVQVADQDSGAYQAILSQFGTYTNPFLTVQPFVASNTTNNAYGYHSATIDNLLTKIEETPVSKTVSITKDWWTLETAENQAGANLPLFSGRAVNVVNKKLHGVQFAGEQTYFATAWWGK
ncbi:MAG: ABC transporter substrate-binding protein [Nitrososphaerales archaeon]